MINILFEWVRNHRNRCIMLLAALFLLDAFLLAFVAQGRSGDLAVHFLDVGQGDSALVFLPGGVKLLIDGGPMNGRVLDGLAETLPFWDRTIDLVFASHPQLDHIGGLIGVVERYRVSAFLRGSWEGEEIAAARELKRALARRKVPIVSLKPLDKVRFLESAVSVLGFGKMRQLSVNDASLVLELSAKNMKTLFTGDIGAEREAELARTVRVVDVLKVPHHGSRFSSSQKFLEAIAPKIAVIEVGKNSYGHPTLEVLRRLASIGASVYRTDENGRITVVADGAALRVFKQK